MSFLKNILKASELAAFKEGKERCEITSKEIILLTEQMESLMWNLKNILSDYYVNLQPKYVAQNNLHNKMSKIGEEYNKLHTISIELITQFNDESFQDQLEKLQKNYDSLNVLVQLANCKKKIEEVNMELYKLNYGTAFNLLLDVQKCLLHNSNCESDIQMTYDKLMDDVAMKYALCASQISAELEECFKFTENVYRTSIIQTIEIDHSDKIRIHNLFKVLYKCELLNVQLLSFSEFFVHKLLDKALKHNCLITSDECLMTMILTIKYEECIKIKPSIQDTLKNLTAILGFLHTTIDVEFHDGNTLLSVLADIVSEKFFKLFAEDCLKSVLPDTESKLAFYEDIIDELDAFNIFLTSIKFIKEETSPLKGYLNQSKSILFEKKIDRFLLEAKSLMKHSLQLNTKIVGAENGSDTKFNKSTNISNDMKFVLNAPIFFPRCKVSSDVIQLLDLVIANINEGIELPEYLQRHIVMAVKNIAVIYQTLVPKLNEESLRNDYLHIALFFNNCLYLAHGFLGPPWQKNLPRNMADNLSALLLDEIQNLRVLGLNVISQCLQDQKKFITDAVKPNDVTPLTLQYCSNLNHAISQSLLRIQTLVSIWQAVLPSAVYEKAISSVVSSLCRALVSKLLGCREQGVSEEIILNISLKFNDVVEQIPQYFEKHTDLNKMVSDWDRLRHTVELLRVQQDSLASSWGAGEGELARHFSCEEIRKIIKIRFANDESRIKILDLIQ